MACEGARASFGNILKKRMGEQMENKIRILHVAQAAGGVDRYLKMLLKHLNHDCFENILVCSHDFNRDDYDGLADGFEYVDMQRSIGVADFVSVKEVRKLLKKYMPDIVYGHSSKAGAISRLANICTHHICIYNPHGWAFDMKCGRTKQKIYALIEKALAPLCDEIICISEHEKFSALEKRICRENKLIVILNGVDIEEYESGKGISAVNRSDYGIMKDAFVVGMVGRISRQKAPDIFIKAAMLIKKKIPNAFFVIVGDGEMRGELEHYAKEHGLLNSLLITGWVNNALDYVDMFDVALLLSRWEGFGLAIPEYMMAGKPVVASNVDAIPSIIKDGENGLLVEVDDIDRVAESVVAIHNNPALRNKLRENGIVTVRRGFDVKRTAGESENLFISLSKSGRIGM